MVVRVIALVILLTVVAAADQAETIRAAMQASLDQQKASVRKQVETAKAVEPGTFFTIPWPARPQEPPYEAPCEAMAEPELASLIGAAAKREDLDPKLVRAVVRKESAARPCALSAKGAQGLMQIMPATAADLGLANPFDPKQNIDAGTKLLKQLLNKYAGDVSLALGAYNAGSGRVDKEGGVPDIAETQNYVSDTMNSLKP